MAFPRIAAAAPLALVCLLASCTSAGGHRSEAGVLRLGYVSELAQAAPLVGVREGLYRSALGTSAALRLATFTDDGAAAAALAAGSTDAAYLDPTSAFGDFSSVNRRPSVTVMAGAASGGAMLVTRDTITAVGDLRGRTIAVPRSGSAQDVALRTWLGSISPDPAVAIVAVDGPATLAAFRSGEIDGAWLPEPWATRLVTDGGGRILVDERALWPGGAFSSAVLAVRTDFAARYPDIVRRLVRGHVAAEDLLNANPALAQRDAAFEIFALTGQDVTTAIPSAWPRMRFTNDPLVATLQEAADHAKPAEVRRRPDLRGFVNVASVNSILHASHKATVGQ